MPGPKKDEKSIKEIMAYRKTIDRTTGKPLSFRKISKIMECDVALVYRWYKYGVDRLSTISG